MGKIVHALGSHTGRRRRLDPAGYDATVAALEQFEADVRMTARNDGELMLSQRVELARGRISLVNHALATEVGERCLAHVLGDYPLAVAESVEAQLGPLRTTTRARDTKYRAIVAGFASEMAAEPPSFSGDTPLGSCYDNARILPLLDWMARVQLASITDVKRDMRAYRSMAQWEGLLLAEITNFVETIEQWLERAGDPAGKSFAHKFRFRKNAAMHAQPIEALAALGINNKTNAKAVVIPLLALHVFLVEHGVEADDESAIVRANAHLFSQLANRPAMHSEAPKLPVIDVSWDSLRRRPNGTPWLEVDTGATATAGRLQLRWTFMQNPDITNRVSHCPGIGVPIENLVLLADVHARTSVYPFAVVGGRLADRSTGVEAGPAAPAPTAPALAGLERAYSSRESL